MSASEAAPLFTRGADGGWRPAEHARGPWDAAQLHGGAPAALLAGLLEAHEPGAGMMVVRLAFEFLGAVPMADLAVRGPAVVKSGRRFQVLQAELLAGGRTVVVARAVRLRRAGVRLPERVPAGGAENRAEPLLPPPSSGHDRPAFAPFEGEGFHPTAVEVRFVAGAPGSGRSAAWFRLRCPLEAGRQPTPVQRVVAAADFGNGISHALPFERFLFVNCDLTLHLHREPAGEWVGLDARTDLGDDGFAQATSVLHDERGRIGIAAQSLFVAER